MTGFAVALMTSRSTWGDRHPTWYTNIILYDRKIGRIWLQCNQRLIIVIINLFRATGLFLYPLKSSENQRLSNVSGDIERERGIKCVNALSLHFFQVYLNWLFLPVWCTCIVKINNNFIYYHFLFAYVSDVIDCFQKLSIQYVNLK